MKAILDWFKQDTRWAWLLLALILGLFSDSFYCASLVGGTAIIAYVAGINKGVEAERKLLDLCADSRACVCGVWVG